MASSLFRNLKGISQNIPYYHLFKNHSVGIVVVAALSAPLLYIANADYRAWLQLGRAGLPYNLFGWLLQLTLTPLRARRFDTTCYSDPIVVAKASPPGSKSYLSAEDIPQRQGSRPSIYHWVLPHRQSDSRSSEEWKTRVERFLTILADNSPSQLSASRSVLERGGPALLINPRVEKHPGARGTFNEIVHLHPLDGSLHMSLAPLDAKLVIEKGWGERFPLSGTIIPFTYIMVYAPRSGENEAVESEIVERIIMAARGFMLGDH